MCHVLFSHWLCALNSVEWFPGNWLTSPPSPRFSSKVLCKICTSNSSYPCVRLMYSPLNLSLSSILACSVRVGILMSCLLLYSCHLEQCLGHSKPSKMFRYFSVNLQERKVQHIRQLTHKAVKNIVENGNQCVISSVPLTLSRALFKSHVEWQPPDPCRSHLHLWEA